MRRVPSEYQFDPQGSAADISGDDVLAYTIVQWSRAHTSSKSD